nr:hypothetical protein [Halosolutus gelatinilyticus]
MTDYSCPLCPDTYGDRTNLHVHLEVEHRKSEIVSYLVETLEMADSNADDRSIPDEKRPIPPA